VPSVDVDQDGRIRVVKGGVGVAPCHHDCVVNNDTAVASFLFDEAGPSVPVPPIFWKPMVDGDAPLCDVVAYGDKACGIEGHSAVLVESWFQSGAFYPIFTSLARLWEKVACVGGEVAPKDEGVTRRQGHRGGKNPRSSQGRVASPRAVVVGTFQYDACLGKCWI